MFSTQVNMGPDKGGDFGGEQAGTERGNDTDVVVAQISEELERGESVDLSNMPREQRLQVINAFLESKNLRALEGLGDAGKGQMEFIGINSFAPDRFVARVDFQTALGEGEKRNTFNHLNFISANTAVTSGMVTVPVVRVEGESQEYVVLVRHYRPTIGKDTVELTRGFPDKDDIMLSKPVKAALRELEEETGLVSESAGALSITQVGKHYENSGTTNVCNDIYRVDISMTPEQFNAVQGRRVVEGSGLEIKTILATPREAMDLLEDDHSIAALARVFL